MFEDLEKIQGKTIQSVDIHNERDEKAVITFTDGATLELKFIDDSWGSSYIHVEFNDMVNNPSK